MEKDQLLPSKRSPVTVTANRSDKSLDSNHEDLEKGESKRVEGLHNDELLGLVLDNDFPLTSSPQLIELFNAVKLIPPNRLELIGWSLFILAYGATVSAPAFFPLTIYASQTIQNLLKDTATPLWLQATLIDAVKLSSVVPTILSVNSGRLRLAHALDECHRYFQRGGWPELASRMPGVLLKESVPLTVSWISSFGAGNVAESRLEDGPYAQYKDWCAISAQISATVTNSRQLNNLAVDPWIASRQSIGDVSILREALQQLLKQYLVALDNAATLAKKTLQPRVVIEGDNIEAPLLVDTSLVKHFISMRDISQDSTGHIGMLLAEMIYLVNNGNVSRPVVNTWRQWLEGKIGQGRISQMVDQTEQFFTAYGTNLLNAICLLTSAIYTIPQFVSASEAGPFAASEGIHFLLDWLLGGGSFAVNAFINFYGLWTLYSALTAPKTVDRDWTDIGLLMLKSLLVAVYTISQLGIVKAFPFEPSFMPEQSYPDIAWLQLALATVVATGLALFSISSAFEQFAAYKLKWQKASVLATLTVNSPLSTGVIQAILNDLKQSNKTLSSRVGAVASKEVDSIVAVIPNGPAKQTLTTLTLQKAAANQDVKRPVYGCLPCVKR